MGSRAHSTVARLHPLALTFYGLESLALLLLFSAAGKPLLWDEFVYFAAGGLPDTHATLGAISSTTTNLNQGVTGAFLLSDFWLLKSFGASSIALRLPGLVAGALLLAFVAAFLVLRRTPIWILLLAPWLFATQELVMRYVGEARTYMPLAASVVGILTYYSLTPTQRHLWWGRAIGWTAVLVGVLFHPYFSVYWAALCVYAYLVWGRRQRFIAFANPLLVVIGTTIFVVVGLMTWARGKADADVDPFNFLPGSLPIEIAAQNLYFATSSNLALWAVAGIFTLWVAATLVVRVPPRSLAKVLIPPVALTALAYALSLFLAFSTIVNEFWIFPRQWIASVTLIALAITWGAGEWAKVLARDWLDQGRASPIPSIFALATVILCVLSAGPSIQNQVSALSEWSQRVEDETSRQAELKARLDAGDQLTDAEWVSFAQNNIDIGGQVWPEFGRYYTDIDWTRFRLVDGSVPS
jgi:hypothetical protein